MIKLSEDKTELSYDKFVKRGSMMQLRSALGLNDPDHLYNYLKASPVLMEGGVTPEDFGVFHPVADKYKDKSKEQLIHDMTEIILQNQKMELMERYHENFL